MSWASVKLGEISGMKYGKMPPSEVLCDEGYPIFSGYRITGYSKEYLYNDPQVIVVARGVGGTGDVKMSPEKSWITNLSVVLTVDNTRVDKLFLFYRLGQEPLKEKLNTGAAQAQITIDSLQSYLINIPDIKTQSRIAEILFTYDSLIENNNRRIALLEESARLLYREWFVYLRFPGYEHTRIVDSVPDGWEKKTLGEVCDDIRETASPQELAPDTPYIGLEHLPRRSITLSSWGRADEVTSSKHKFKTGEIIFGKIRPYFHKVGIAFVDGVASSDAIVIRAKTEELRNLVLMIVSSDSFVAQASQTMREGSKMPRADWKIMKQYPVALPTDGLLSAFNGTIEPIVEQLKTLSFQNHKLQAARDLLLPRLMNGEVAV